FGKGAEARHDPVHRTGGRDDDRAFHAQRKRAAAVGPLPLEKESKLPAKARADIVDSGVLIAEDLSVAHVHPAGFDAHAVADLIADAKFRLEEHSASKCNFVVTRPGKIA